MAFKGNVPDLVNLCQLTRTRKYYIDDKVMIIPDKPAKDVMDMTFQMFKVILNTRVVTMSKRQLAMGGMLVKDNLGFSRIVLSTWVTDDKRNFNKYKVIYMTKERLAIMLYIAIVYVQEVDEIDANHMVRIMKVLAGTRWYRRGFVKDHCPYFNGRLMLLSDIWMDQYDFHKFINLLILDLRTRTLLPVDRSKLTCDFDEDEILNPTFKNVEELISSCDKT